METIKGKISRVIFQNEETGYKVLKVDTVGGQSSIITGEFGPEVIPGSVADFHGDYKNSLKHGYQFKTKSYTLSFDAGEMASIKLFIDTIAPNIGIERSRLIVDHFGKDTIDILEKEPHRLSEVSGIGKRLSSVLAQAWTENRDKWRDERQQYSLRAFLNSLGIKERRVKRVLAHFGGGLLAEEKIRENPYVLCDIDGFGFTTADHIATQVGLPADSELRFRAFISYSLEIICPSSGHLYLEKQDIIGYTRKYCAENATAFLGRDITVDDLEETLLILSNEKKIIVEGNVAYSKPCYDFEKKAAQRLAQIMTKESDLIFLTKRDVEDHIEDFERENQISLSDKQKDTLYDFIEKKVFVITGGPGTGKTTILRTIVSLIKKLKLKMTCMTPTGISAKKLSTTIDYEAYTIHRRLGFKGNQWTNNEFNPFETDVAIIDESSMIDMEVLYRMLSALKDRVHIIFVGDDNQLPSVGAGNVLREIINCGVVPVVRLDRIFRQDEASDIIKVAHQIKNGNTDLTLFKPDPTADVFFMRESNPDTIEKIIVAIAQKLKKEKKMFQIITPRNNGPASVETLNNLLQQVLNPPAFDSEEMKCYNYILRKGDRIIVRKNDYERMIFNGDIGKIINIGGGFIVIDIDGRSIQLTVEEVDEKIKLAYSITIHRCISKNSMVFCKDGIRKIDEIKKGIPVHTINNEVHPIIGKVLSKNLKKVIIKTNFGYFLEASSDHRILVANKKGEEFKKISDINKKTDYLCISRKNIPGKAITLHIKNGFRVSKIRPNRHYPRIEINLPLFLDEDISWMLGALIGDGCYTDKDDGTVEFTSPMDIDLLEKMRKIWENLGLNVGSHKRKGIEYSIYVISKNFREWLYSIGLDYVTAHYKRVPNMMFFANKKCRASFLRGLFDSDGGTSIHTCRYTSTSFTLIIEIHLILLSLGIISSIRNCLDRPHKIHISGCSLLLYKKIVGFCSLRKKEILTSPTIRGEKTNVESIPFGLKIAKDIHERLKINRTRGIKGLGLFSPKMNKTGSCLHGVLSGNNRLTRTLLKNLLIYMDETRTPIPNYIKDCVSNNYFYDKIESIKLTGTSEDMIDLEVEEKQSFVANGIICHNSQGLEYPYIIIPFINQHGKNMLQRNLLYTALTRAKEKAIIIGHGSAIEKAINNASVSKRNTKLGERIKTCLLLKQSDSSQISLEGPDISQDVPKNTEQSSLTDLISCLTELTEKL
jgi:exodeoxyribonuclease V alpha subunit